MEGQSPVRKQTKFSRRILCSNRRILQSPMFDEHPMVVALFLHGKFTLTFSWDCYGHQGGTGLSVLAFAFHYRSSGSLYLCHLEVHESMPLVFPVNK